MELKTGSTTATTNLINEISASLRRKRKAKGKRAKDLQATSGESQRLTEDVLQLDFTKIVSALRSSKLTAELKTTTRDSARKLTLALYELFSELSKSYEGSPIAKDALGEISQEFKKLSSESQETYASKLKQLTKELEMLAVVRNVYVRNARAAGFEQDFMDLIRGGQ